VKALLLEWPALCEGGSAFIDFILSCVPVWLRSRPPPCGTACNFVPRGAMCGQLVGMTNNKPSTFLTRWSSGHSFTQRYEVINSWHHSRSSDSNEAAHTAQHCNMAPRCSGTDQAHSSRKQ